jgi:hypothetical protein
MVLAKLAILVAVAINIAAAETRAQESWSAVRSAWLTICRGGCQQGRTPAQCSAYCDCIMSRLESILGHDSLMSSRVLTEEELRAASEATAACIALIGGR